MRKTRTGGALCDLWGGFWGVRESTFRNKSRKNEGVPDFTVTFVSSETVTFHSANAGP